ncbi:MAG: SIS domain-containing protein [Puniceicoccales bacterium]|jgi:D-sedoheptulose 7-phosphate isomerase|nr:SIS domain-containing protein [Puniceicoccales bacterium]
MNALELLWERYPQLSICRDTIMRAYDILVASFENGGKLLLAGNGGSAADAGHISGELLKSFCKKRLIPRNIATKIAREIVPNLEGALPAIPLPDFVSFHTAYANDRNGEYNFAQLVLALGNENDVLWALSTSGNSRNIIHAIEIARAKTLRVIGLTGRSGGMMRDLCTACICVPEEETFKIQELHLPVYHAICQALEAHFFKN